MLRLPETIVQTLSELGIHGVGQLRRLPRERLPSRFGPRILQRLDQAFGSVPEMIVVEHPAEPIVATWAAQEPFRDRRLLLEVCRRLLDRMLAPLQSKRRGVRRLLCHLHGCGGRPCELSVGLVSATNSVKQIQDLLELQLERVAWDDEITLIRLEATEVASLEERPRDLFGDQLDEGHARELRWLLERLTNRLGSDAVVRATYVPDPQPELAVTYQPWITSDKPDGKRVGPQIASANVEEQFGCARPLRLFPVPQPIEVAVADLQGAPSHFFWRNAELCVSQVWGPERIETGWWRGNPVRRDYYRVEVATGERYWLFRSDNAWYLHGTFE